MRKQPFAVPQVCLAGALVALGLASACNLISGVGGLPFGGSAGKGDAGTEGGTIGPPTAAQLLALTTSCKAVSSSDYENDLNPVSPGNIPVCGLNGAVFWQSGLSIDCDGLESTSSMCPGSSNETAATDSMGMALDSLTLPFVVLPAPSGCSPVPWDYGSSGISLGAVIAVIYNGKITYGVFGDTGDCSTIGQASYAMATSLGINPGPTNPGVESGVTYIAFKGNPAVVSPIENHADATTLGEMLAAQLITAN